MAYTLPGRLVYALQDSTGVRTSLAVPVLFDPTKTGTQLAAAVNTQAGLLDAVTGAKVLSVEAVIEPALTITPKSPSPIPGRLLENTGNVDYPYGSPSRLFDSIIPGIQSAILVPSGKDIDETNAAFMAYIAPFETPVAEWEATNNGHVPFSAAHVDTFVSFRKHRRRRGQVSRETP
jgi:hypothetical protein